MDIANDRGRRGIVYTRPLVGRADRIASAYRTTALCITAGADNAALRNDTRFVRTADRVGDVTADVLVVKNTGGRRESDERSRIARQKHTRVCPGAVRFANPVKPTSRWRQACASGRDNYFAPEVRSRRA